MIVLNRARAKHAGGTRIRFVWPCGKYRTVDYSKKPVTKRLGEEGCRLMVRMWRSTGTTVSCPKHGRFANDCGFWVLDDKKNLVKKA